jgi:hypothetical protein
MAIREHVITSPNRNPERDWVERDSGFYNNPLTRQELLITLCSAPVSTLATKAGMLLQDDILFLKNWKLRLPPYHFGFFTLLNQETRGKNMLTELFLP